MTEAGHAGGEFVKAAGGLLWRHSGVELQVAVIHRPQKSDWTLPKGKLEEGESWREAALREVREETQCEVSLGQFIGSSRYISRGRPKVVLYWHMDLGTERPFTANREVDRLVWLTCEQALQRLMYANEKALLKRAYYVARSPGIEGGFEEAARAWSNVLTQQFGDQMAQSAIAAARQALKELIPRLPYIGGNDNHLTDTLIDSARCLALYVALSLAGRRLSKPARFSMMPRCRASMSQMPWSPAANR